MYEEFFGLTRRPFASTPDPERFVPVRSAAAVVDQLRQCFVADKGIAVLTGPAGVGKTIVCRKLLHELQGDFTPVFLASGHYLTRRALLQALLYELGQPYARMDEQELRLEIATALRTIQSRSRGVLLAVDEAHLLSPRLLEAVRTLTNIHENGEPVLRVLLSGQIALEEILTTAELDALNQRIGAHQTLDPYERVEAEQYLATRIVQAGAQLCDVFTPAAVAQICQASDGVPRCLNQLCEQSLLLAAAAEQRPVDVPIVQAALEELKHLPLPWNDLGTHEPVSRNAAESSERSQHVVGTRERATTRAVPADATDNADLEAHPACIEVGAPAETNWPAEAAVTLAEEDSALTLPWDTSDCCTATSSGRSTATAHPCREKCEEFAAKDDHLVYDRYALLDAGCSVLPSAEPARRPVSADSELPELAELRADEVAIEAVEYRSVLPCRTPAASWVVERLEPSAAPFPEHDFVRMPRADRVIEGVLPMIAAVLDGTLDEPEPAESDAQLYATARGVWLDVEDRPSQRDEHERDRLELLDLDVKLEEFQTEDADDIETSPAAGVDLHSEIHPLDTPAVAEIDDDVEDRIHALVQDALYQAQQAYSDRSGDTEPASAGWGRESDRNHSTPAYDVVEPEAVPAASPATEPERPASLRLAPPPERRYGRLFSTLRRRILRFQ